MSLFHSLSCVSGFSWAFWKFFYFVHDRLIINDQPDNGLQRIKALHEWTFWEIFVRIYWLIFILKITDKCHIIMILTYTSFTNFWIDSSEVFISVQEHTCNLRGDVFLKSRRLRKRGENNSGVVNWRHAATFKTTNITTSLSTGDICVCCKVCRDHSEILRHLCCCTQLHTRGGGSCCVKNQERIERMREQTRFQLNN